MGGGTGDGPGGGGVGVGVGFGVGGGGGVAAEEGAGDSGGGVNGGGGGGVESGDGGLGCDGFGGFDGSFMVIGSARQLILSGTATSVKKRSDRSTTREKTGRCNQRGAQFRKENNPIPPKTVSPASKPMEALPRLLILLAGLSLAAARVNARTMLDLPGFPAAGLHVYLPAEAYSKLANAPVKAWIQLRGQIVNSKVTGARVVRSEGGGVYDKASVQIANGMEVYTDVTTSRLPPSVVIHVLIYQLPKGEHAIALAQDDSLGASNFIYSRSIRMRFLGLANEKAPVPGPKPKKK